jgi:prophage tail gpP-like protein
MDCPFPYSTYPLEFNGMDLKQIAIDSAKIFGVKVDFRGNAGAVFEKVSPEPTQKILDFLITLAKQRGFLITNNTKGDLLIWKISSSQEVAYFEEGEIPFISCFPTFDPQNYYSEITGLNPETETTDADSYTWKNPFLKGVTRPSVIDLKDVDNADLQSSVESYAGRMFGNAGKYQLSINTHKNKDGLLFSSNQFVAALAPKSQIYKRYQFLVNSCTLDRSADNGDTTVFDLELPGARTGELPKDLPWEA